MDMELLKNLVDYGVIVLLIFMSFIAVMLFIERLFFYRKIDVNKYKNKKQLDIALTKNLTFIGTIASNSPYIGLLGTVLGIMLTFYSMGENGVMDSGKIMMGLALALKVTAVGLLVAIPAVTIYNLLLRKCKVMLTQWEINNGRERI